jgi:uroporphyrinogen-III synthase
LRAEGFDPQLCTVAIERPPVDPAPLRTAAADLDQFDWVICASARAVRALANARRAPWPVHVRAAAVGSSTAAALSEAGAIQPFMTSEAGADALWTALEGEDRWEGRRVLVPNVRGGRQGVIDGLVSAGAHLTIVEAYVMEPRPIADIARAWHAIDPDSAVIASPSVAARLAEAVGVAALQNLRAIVAMGRTTTSALGALNVPSTVPVTTDFASIARHLRTIRAARDLV